jgi:hypothetical protein
MLDYGGLVPVLAAADVLAGQTTEKRRCARRQATHVQAGRQASGALLCSFPERSCGCGVM